MSLGKAIGVAVGGTFAALLAMVAGSLAATAAQAIAPGQVLLATALMWLVAVPLLFLLGTRVLGLDAAIMGLRPPEGGSRRPRYILGAAVGMSFVLVPALVGRLAGGYLPMPLDAIAALPVPTGSAAVPAILFTLPALMLAAGGEEVLFRGLLLRLWQPLLGAKGALVMSALLFVAVHVGNPGAAPRGAIGVLLAGIALGALFLATNDLWVVAGAHLGWNAAEALLIGVPVSGITLPAALRWQVADTPLWQGLLGGSFGPEEGLLFHAALGLAAVVSLVLAAIAGAFLPPGEPPPSPPVEIT